MRFAIVAVLLSVSTAFAEDIAVPEGTITRSSPVAPADSAKSLKQHYGDEAVIQDDLSTGVEDITYKGLVLMPRVPDPRIEVSFTNETMSRLAGLTLINQKGSHWNVAGVTPGSTLAQVQRINGKPFFMREFLTDGGGFVVSWNGGMLGRALPGGCRISVRFGRGRDMGAPAGDLISSDNAALLKWEPVVEQIGVRFRNK